MCTFSDYCYFGKSDWSKYGAHFSLIKAFPLPRKKKKEEKSECEKESNCIIAHCINSNPSIQLHSPIENITNLLIQSTGDLKNSEKNAPK